MQGNEIIREYQSKCVRCGQCRFVCPVLDILGKESASPRGKVYLAGLMARGTTEITNTRYIYRGYYDLEKKLRQLGADITVIGNGA